MTYRQPGSMSDKPIRDSDQDYLERRRRECLARAESVTDPAIAEVHRKFAAEYARKLAPDGAARDHIPAVVTLLPQQGYR